jgi:hypothetical protein
VTPSGFTSINSVVDPSYTYDRIYEQQPAEKLRVYRYVESSPTKFRNGLATVAGFAGLAVVFSRFSISPLIWSLILGVCGVSSHACGGGFERLILLLIPLPNMVAPVALWLAVEAFRDLDEHPEESGRIQAVVAVITGCLGTILLAVDIAICARMSF